MKRDAKGRFTSSKQESKTTEEKVYATGFKGFEKGLICRGKQYAENTVFEEPEAKLCERGMHFCENPLDVLEYYPLLNGHALAPRHRHEGGRMKLKRCPICNGQAYLEKAYRGYTFRYYVV